MKSFYLILGTLTLLMVAFNNCAPPEDAVTPSLLGPTSTPDPNATGAPDPVSGSALDTSKPASCAGSGLTWTAATSTCTISTNTSSNYIFDSITIAPGTTVSIVGTSSLTITSNGDINIDGNLILPAQNANQNTPGKINAGGGIGGSGGLQGAAGTSGGGQGTPNNNGTRGLTSGEAYPGQGGAGGNGSGGCSASFNGGGGGAGGGLLKIIGTNFKIGTSGYIAANGGNGGNGTTGDCSGTYGGGGGSGGTIIFKVRNNFTNQGTIEALGGGRGVGNFYGEYGGGGAISVYFSNPNAILVEGKMNVYGGEKSSSPDGVKKTILSSSTF